VAHMGEMRGAYIVVGRPEGRRPGVDGRTPLKLISRKLGLRMWIGLIWLRIGIRGGLLCTR
jgi:hypothetical protein